MFFTSQIYVLAVGVNNTLGQRGEELNKTEEDVRHFTDHIKERFPDGEVIHLLGRNATCGEIKDSIEQISVTVSSKNAENSLFVFYFTGHGTTTSKATNAGNLLTTTTLITNETKYEDEQLADGLAIGAKDERDTLLGMVSKIPIKKLIILDTCHGCATTRTKRKQPLYVGTPKGVHLPQGNQEADALKDNPDLLPEACLILSACDMSERAHEGKKGSYFTNTFLEAVSRDYYPPESHPDNPWLTEDGKLVDKADEVDLRDVIARVNKRMEELGVHQTAHIIPPEDTLRFPRLLDHHLSMKHSWNIKKIGFDRPPVPDKVIRKEYSDEVENRLLNNSLSSFIVHGPSLSGKTTAVAVACKKVCYTKWDNPRSNRSRVF